MKLHAQVERAPNLTRYSYRVGGRRAVVVAGVVAAPFVIAGYVGLTMMLILPLLGLRWMFPYRSTPSAAAWYGEALCCADAGSLSQ